MSLFRRRPRESGEAEGRGAEPSSASPPAAGTPDAARSPYPTGAPPPLPAASPDAGGAGGPGERFTRCFVCDSPLGPEGCPRCRIAWVE